MATADIGSPAALVLCLSSVCYALSSSAIKVKKYVLTRRRTFRIGLCKCKIASYIRNLRSLRTQFFRPGLYN
ncbi:hypothetical protein FB451DRAFT_1277264 [Mycena latifolia]|nr:hypothetical protein FB451DRAFT_1277264 [Mycena latifolia]